MTRFRRPAVRYQGDYNWGAGQRLSVGYDWERETNPGVAGFDLDNNAVFVQHQSTFADRWFLTIGARVDSKESYDTYFSPKLSAGGFVLPYRAGMLSSIKLFGNIGRGVKSPTFTERFGGAGFADPNPDINVEQAKSGDVGVESTFADQRIRSTFIFFRNDFTDQISYRFGPIGDGIPEYINIDGSKASGIELELALQRPLAGFTAMGTYSFVDTEVVTNQSTSQQFQPGQPLLAATAALRLVPRGVHARPCDGQLQPANDRSALRQQFPVAADGAERGAANRRHDRHHDQSGLSSSPDSASTCASTKHSRCF